MGISLGDNAVEWRRDLKIFQVLAKGFHCCGSGTLRTLERRYYRASSSNGLFRRIQFVSRNSTRGRRCRLHSVICTLRRRQLRFRLCTLRFDDLDLRHSFSNLGLHLRGA